MRCKFDIYVKKKYRKCKNYRKNDSEYCGKHQKIMNDISDSFKEFDNGKCCYCGGECNPASQACGTCVRSVWYR